MGIWEYVQISLSLRDGELQLMSTGNVHKAIAEGIDAGKARIEEFGISEKTKKKFPWKHWSEHPNKTMLLPDKKSWTIGRQTMDKRKGKKGYVIFTVDAVDGAEAKRMVEDMVAQINKPFLKKLRADTK